ncbi:MAG: hypothetical protein KDE33_10465 [Bacteroidetes bacterium]|nr:hypothetical protein [Bacteroidota bacterium]
MYKLDRNHFKMQSFEESSNQTEYWKNKTVEERFKAAWYLICSAYNLPYTTDIKLDRTAFKMRKNG